MRRARKKWNQLNIGEKALSSQTAAQGHNTNEHISEAINKLEDLDVKFDNVLQALHTNGVLADSYPNDESKRK